MVPSTRLRSMPERRINYAARANGIHASAESPDASPTTAPRRVARVKAGAVVKPKSGPKVREKAPARKKKERPAKRECSICATEKVPTRSFKAPDDACEHLRSICNMCVAKMLKTKVAERQLGEAELSCPFPKCGHLLDYPALTVIVSTAAFEDYDTAVTKHALSMGESYVACLSPDCGLYFSADDCKNKKSGMQLVACPYCDYEICLECNRPGKSHGKGSCDQAKKEEEELCMSVVKEMGAKPCPSCGLNLQKKGGCDHVKCAKCGHHFCWVCLVKYTNDIQHLDDCPHARVRIANQPGNWAQNNLTNAQLNNLIAQAGARLDNPAVAPAAAPMPLPLPPPAPVLPNIFGGFLDLDGRSDDDSSEDEG
ncbi:hypothetical protein ACET3X_008537 [Alternaria dauci]|uniref:RING-type domain-containing protein n=1 Tax=Alternaria dauci TaxID=48095 RepID=A0ABR3UB45_9PLEO